MKRLGFLILAGILPLYADTLAIIHINDTHHHLYPYKAWNGVSSAAYVIKRLKSLYPNHLFFHAGDIFVGDFSFPYGLGRVELRILKNILRPDAITLGNHEFDITPDSLYAVLTDVGMPMPILSANLTPDTLPISLIVQPYATFIRSGKKICVLGLTTNQFNILSPAQQPVQFENPVTVAQNYEDTLTALGCDYRIILSHSGVNVDSAIARQTRYYNLIISGHTHTCYDSPAKIVNLSGDTTYFAEACSHYQAVGFWLIDLNTLRPISYTLIRLNNTTPIDGETWDTLMAYKPLIESGFGNVFDDFWGYAPAEIPNIPDIPGYLDTPAGNLVADAMRVKSGADAAAWPTFLIAEELQAGRITSNNVLMLVPYGLDETYITGNNTRLLVATFTGKQIYNLLSTTQAFFGEQPIAQVSGMRYRYDPTSSPVMLPSDIEIGGFPLDTNANYTLAVDKNIIYVAGLLGITPLRVDTTPYTVFEAVREYIRDLWIVEYHSEGRITYKNLSAYEIPTKTQRLNVLNRFVYSQTPMDIYDITGRLIAKGVYRFLAPKSGVYFIRLADKSVKVIIR
ncbi:MAG: 5'-nucleotidase C-terminal domain-containing protein [candidate division WOR-3 bacterium]